MADLNKVLDKFLDISDNWKNYFDNYIKEGKKIVLFGPLYGPEEIVHSMGMIPFGVWGVDEEINEAKRYFPAFIPSLLQSILELGITNKYEGALAFTQPLLSDSTKCLGENWKYAVKDIKYLPMQFPQNRKPVYGVDLTEENYKWFIKELEEMSGVEFSPEKLQNSIEIYNKHNELMRKADELMSKVEISNRARNSVFKSAFHVSKDEHIELLEELIPLLETNKEDNTSKRVVTSGIVADSIDLLEIFDENNLKIVGDDIAQESRQYRTDSPKEETSLRSLAQKFSNQDNCSLLYDEEKKRADYIVNLVKERNANGVVFLLTKFSDPEEFDYVIIKKALDKEGISSVIIEIDRQMQSYEQAKTILQTFSEII